MEEKKDKNYVPGFAAGLLTFAGYGIMIHSSVADVIDKARDFVYDSDIVSMTPGEAVSLGIGALVTAGAGLAVHYFANKKKKPINAEQMWLEGYNSVKEEKEKGDLSKAELIKKHNYLKNQLYTLDMNNFGKDYDREKENLDDLVQDVELRLR